MPLQFVSLAEQHLDAVRAFNHRMRDASAPTDFLLPERLARTALRPDGTIRWTQFLALDANEVHGGVIEMDQPGWLGDHQVRTLNYQAPLSEGIINRKHAMVVAHIVKFMQRRGEAVFIVGMGSAANPLPQLLRAAGWSVRAVPFLFRVHRPGSFLRELPILHRTPTRSITARAAARTGIGSLALRLMQLRARGPKATIRQVKYWGEWADEIWQRFRPYCSFAVQRDRQTLSDLYPEADRRLNIFLIERGGDPVAWAVCFDTRANDHPHLRPHFGSLRVASILDCAASPDDMRVTAVLTDREMAFRGADVVVSNQSHARWLQAFRSAGYLRGPSIYQLAMSKTLTEAIRSRHHGERGVHVTRGDGDGRISLG